FSSRMCPAMRSMTDNVSSPIYMFTSYRISITRKLIGISNTDTHLNDAQLSTQQTFYGSRPPGLIVQYRTVPNIAAEKISAAAKLNVTVAVEDVRLCADRASRLR